MDSRSQFAPFRFSNAIGYAKFYSRSHYAGIRVCDSAGNVIETHEHAGDFKDWQGRYRFLKRLRILECEAVAELVATSSPTRTPHRFSFHGY